LEPLKRALWVTAVPPSHNAGGGGHIRQAHLLDALCSRFETHLLLAGTLADPELGGRLASVREVSVAPPPDPRRRSLRRLRDLRRAFVERVPGEVSQARRVRRALAPLIADGPDVDLVCVEYVGLAPLLPRRRSAHWALTLHNLTSGMARQAGAFAPSARHRLMLAAEERNSLRVEADAVAAYDTVFAVSGEDAADLPAGAVVVPNGVDVDRHIPTPIGEAPRVVFTGALHTFPNRDGIGWFSREVWPRIRAQVPKATLAVVGAQPPEEVVALGRIEGVTVHPDVPQVEPFLERCRVAVVPLRIGTGSRLKALEAMACARPVVGTSVGLGGLDLQHERQAMIADDPESFSDAVVRCLVDRDLTTRLGEEGRAFTVARHSWERIGADYVSFLWERVGQDPPPGRP